MTPQERYFYQIKGSDNDSRLRSLESAPDSAAADDDLLDRYIIVKVKLREKHLAYIDLKDYEAAKTAMQEDLRKEVAKELDLIADEFNKKGKITLKV